MNSFRSHPSAVIAELRETLRTRFPEAHREKVGQKTRFLLGVDTLDSFAFSPGTCAEITAGGPLGHGALLLRTLLEAAADAGRQVALVDGADAFDPQSCGAWRCRTLLWTRCGNAADAVRAADLLLRDGNIPLVLIDLQLCPEQQLHRLPSSHWFRLRNLATHSGCVALVFSRRPLVSAARPRLELSNRYSLTDLDQPAAALYDAFLLEDRRRGRDEKNTESTPGWLRAG